MIKSYERFGSSGVANKYFCGMGNEGKNGIIGFKDMFNIQPTGLEDYNREEDILPLGDDKKKPEVEPELEEGGGTAGAVGAAVSKEDENPSVVEKGVGSGHPDGKKLEAKKEDEKPNPAPTDYIGLIRKLTAKGVLPDLKDAKFGTEDGRELSIDELDMNDETFCDLLASVLDDQKKGMLEDKIDVSSVSEFTKKLIQADRSGANVLDILKQYDRIAAPVEKLSTDTKEDQLKIIRHYVNLLGLPKDEADEFFKGILAKGDEYIEAKAIKYKSDLDKRMNELIEEKTRRAQEQRQKDAEEFKQYKKSLKSSLQSKYQLNDNMVAKAIAYATAPSKSNPNVTEANERIRAMLTDPELAPDLIMFLMNPDEFIKQKSNKQVVAEKQKIFKMISNTNKDRTKSPLNDRGDEVESMKFDEIPLDESKMI